MVELPRRQFSCCLWSKTSTRLTSESRRQSKLLSDNHVVRFWPPDVLSGLAIRTFGAIGLVHGPGPGPTGKRIARASFFGPIYTGRSVLKINDW